MTTDTRTHPASGASVVNLFETADADGPALTPMALEEFERIEPGLAERVVALAERKQSAQAKLAEMDLRDRRHFRYASLAVGAAGLILILGSAIAAMAMGHATTAQWIIGLGVTGIVAAYAHDRFR